MLVEPVRRALYDYVRHQDHPVTREEAAAAHAISRNLTAFHLDKLVEGQLLAARYEAPADLPRGRGRTPKVYEAIDDDVSITIPPRHYELVGQILADAIAEQPADAGEAARRLAFDQGQQLGQQCRAHTGASRSGLGGADPVEKSTADAAGGVGHDLAVAGVALADLGFEPWPDEPAMLSLRNCPFRHLAVRQPELVCGLNLAFVSGLLAGLGAGRLAARLRAHAGSCCVVVSARASALG